LRTSNRQTIVLTIWV